MNFQGIITDSTTPRTGQGKNGEWASVSFEVTEANPRNAAYPEIGGFEMFKSGEYIDYAKDFANKYPVGTLVDVTFQMGKTTYQKKDGSGEGKFYKNNAFKLEVIEQPTQNPGATAAATPVPNPNVVNDTDLPF